MPDDDAPSALAHLPQVFCVLHEGQVTFVSSSSQEVGGIPPEQFHGRLAADLVHPDDRGRIAPFLAPGWAGGIATTVRVQEADGAWTWRRVNGVRTLDDAGRASAAIALQKIPAPDPFPGEGESL